MNTRSHEVIDGETGEVTQGAGGEFPTLGALGVLQKAEIDQQIATAKQYPRSITKFEKRSTELVTRNAAVAQSCNYALPRKAKGGGTKFINGASIRFAEIVAQAFGNQRNAARVIGEDGDYIIAQGVFHDLESNSWTSTEVRRRIVDSNGNRYTVDMIGVTANAACSIAKRNAILGGIGRGNWEPIYQSALSVAKGDIKTLEASRAEIVKTFTALGITEKQICAAVDVEGVKDIGLDERMTLLALYKQIKDGGLSAQAVFAPTTEAAQSPTKDAIAKGLAEQGEDPAAQKKRPEPERPSLDLAGTEALTASAAIARIKACETKPDLERAWKEIRKAYKDANTEMPIEVDGARADRLAAIEVGEVGKKG